MKKGNLLIVEDEFDFADILVETLTQHCSQIFAVTDGKEALEVLENNKNIHAIISDINIPKLTGFQLLTQLRLSGNRIPFITLTAYGDYETLRESIKLNATDFLTKPFDTHELIEVVVQALRYGMQLLEIENKIQSLYTDLKMSAEKTKELDSLQKKASVLRIENSKYFKQEFKKYG